MNQIKSKLGIDKKTLFEMSIFLGISLSLTHYFIKEKITASMFEVSGQVAPSKLAQYEKFITTKQGDKIQIFEILGNPKSDKVLIVAPGIKGPFFHTDDFILNSRDKFKTIVTLSYPTQGRSEGKISQKTMVSALQSLVNLYVKNPEKSSIICASMGAIACSHLKTDARTVFIHPALSSSQVLQTFYDGYYDNINGSWVTTDDQSKVGLKEKLDLLLKNKWVARLVFPTSFTDFYYGARSPNLVYIPNKDELARQEDLKRIFPNALSTGANSHQDLGAKMSQKILDQL